MTDPVKSYYSSAAALIKKGIDMHRDSLIKEQFLKNGFIKPVTTKLINFKKYEIKLDNDIFPLEDGGLRIALIQYCTAKSYVAKMTQHIANIIEQPLKLKNIMDSDIFYACFRDQESFSENSRISDLLGLTNFNKNKYIDCALEKHQNLNSDSSNDSLHDINDVNIIDAIKIFIMSVLNNSIVLQSYLATSVFSNCYRIQKNLSLETPIFHINIKEMSGNKEYTECVLNKLVSKDLIAMDKESTNYRIQGDV